MSFVAAFAVVVNNAKSAAAQPNSFVFIAPILLWSRAIHPDGLMIWVQVGLKVKGSLRLTLKWT